MLSNSKISTDIYFFFLQIPPVEHFVVIFNLVGFLISEGSPLVLCGNLCLMRSKVNTSCLISIFNPEIVNTFVSMCTINHRATRDENNDICHHINTGKANSYKVGALDQLIQITMSKNCCFFLYFVLITNFVFSYCVKSLFIFLLTCFCICM